MNPDFGKPSFFLFDDQYFFRSRPFDNLIDMFTFQDLPDHEIIQGLNAAGIEAKLCHLDTPKPATVAPIYKQYLMVLASFENEDQLSHPHLDRRYIVSEELKSGFGFLNFFRHLQLLMRSAAVPDFSLGDLFRPERERIRHNLSGLINFAIFREERLVTFQMLQDQLNQRIRENQEMDEQIKEVSRRQQEYLIQRAEVDSLENCKRSRDTELSEVEEAIAAVQESLEKRKRDEIRLRSEVESSRRECEQILQDVNTLKVQIGLSEDDIFKDLDRAKAALASSAKESESERQRLRESQTRHKLLTEIRGQLLEASDIAYKAVQERKRCNDFEGEQRLLDQERRELALKKEKLEKLKREKEAKTAAKRKDADAVREMNEAIKKQKQALKKMQDQPNHELFAISDAIDVLRRQIRDYMDKLGPAMEAATIRRI
jgi:kinetochore protein Nuf2